MSQQTSQSTTPTRELRLRSWARKNYTHPRNRQETWHPVVLEEMLIRDQELLEEFSQPVTMSYGYVPLAPTSFRVLHAPHASVKQPNIAKFATRQRAIHEMMLPVDDEQ
ncbi:hypothetical protein MNBD_PLANCTO02-450 [hydrothermal vent metagenome]|uniref:Uncharacterized protein n=1 Tax=hydrothermal vent metagenome TaxID=652676 RepID=A0A3B1E157_9ZZZZ